MTEPIAISTGIAHQIGRYSDAVRVPAGAELIYLSGTPGLRHDGTVPDDFGEEARQAWQNVEEALTQGGASLGDVVSVRQWLISASDIPVYVQARAEFIKHEPASMLAVVTGLVWPHLRVEIEVIAVRPAD